MPADAARCREELQQLLASEQRLLGAIEQLLESEYAAVAANDIESLEARSAQRSQYLSELLRVQEARHRLLQMQGLPAGLEGLRQLTRVCDPAGDLQSRFAECAKRANHCRELNERNRLLVAARLRRVT
ncbi:MAG: flagellar protein FlgN, partial [Steroidobacteraceae bacterium]|nr:flagellar protein FlgN [Steroidobacteraceae bacterium]MDW8258834.1 flagellar protein FlgN [Gammaproteobacteria bacterium]